MSCLVAAEIAFAASLGMTSTKLTVETYASSIPPTTCTLNAAIADSYVNQANPLANFGGATTLDVRSSLAANKRAFVQLGLGPCSIPANSLVTVARLKLFMNNAPASTRTYETHRVTAAWAEAGINWTNQPATAASATDSVVSGTSDNVTLTWDVTTDVQAFVDGTAESGWRIKDATEDAAAGRQAQFRSAEFGTVSRRPILEVTYYP